ncbi:Uncharacterized protein APZ42_026343 [Daphnia magna]|uniref:Uncharacterized protein n=1 Tax=Daphnia magna TaxID=35525 RepID=A0A164SCV1_9CRUS|nr:Uncharacterized protein APZ42_026343 [Daphnia magna]
MASYSPNRGAADSTLTKKREGGIKKKIKLPPTSGCVLTRRETHTHRGRKKEEEKKLVKQDVERLFTLPSTYPMKFDDVLPAINLVIQRARKF